MLPTIPGRHPFRGRDGRIRTVRVIDMNGELYAVRGWWIFSIAVPLAMFEGTWLTA